MIDTPVLMPDRCGLIRAWNSVFIQARKITAHMYITSAVHMSWLSYQFISSSLAVRGWVHAELLHLRLCCGDHFISPIFCRADSCPCKGCQELKCYSENIFLFTFVNMLKCESVVSACIYMYMWTMKLNDLWLACWTKISMNVPYCSKTGVPTKQFFLTFKLRFFSNFLNRLPCVRPECQLFLWTTEK